MILKRKGFGILRNELYFAKDECENTFLEREGEQNVVLSAPPRSVLLFNQLHQSPSLGKEGHSPKREFSLLCQRGMDLHRKQEEVQ